MRWFVFMAVAAAAAPAAAQQLSFDPRIAGQCAAQRPEPAEREQCIGRAADACMENTPGGASTVGMNGCLEAEWQYWDARLNAHYRTAMTRAKAFDVEMADMGMAARQNSLLSAAETLRDMQRAWIAYRDARCDYLRAQWSGGSGQGTAMLACLLQETGRQALWLQVQAGGM